jgi:sec-independent protein translocase protein TatC
MTRQENFFDFIARELDELRGRFIWCLGSLALVAAVLMGAPHWEDSFATRLSGMLKAKLLPPGAHLVFLSPLEPMVQMFKLSLALGFVICLPILVYHFIAFTKPAMPEGMRGFYVKVILLALGLFALGMAVSGYFLAPMTFETLLHYGMAAGGEAQITFERFYSFILLFLITFAAPFEIPLVMAFLHRFNWVSVEWFREHRRQFYGVILLVAQFITPDPLISPMIFTGLGWILYEIGILSCGRL